MFFLVQTRVGDRRMNETLQIATINIGIGINVGIPHVESFLYNSFPVSKNSVRLTPYRVLNTVFRH